MAQPKYKRTKVVVNHSLQYKLTATFLLGIVLSLLVFTVGFVGYYWLAAHTGDGAFEEFFIEYRMVDKEREVEVAGVKTKETYTTTEERPPVRRWEIIAPVILANNILILVILGVIGIRFSHRIAGPIYNINRALDLAVQNRLEREVRLRRRDFFHDTADKLNRVLRSAHLVVPPPPKVEPKDSP